MTERDIFFEALEITTPEARGAYLQGACGRDVTLRRKVDELLKEHFSNDSLLARPALEGDRPTLKIDLAPEESPAQMLGRYKLLEKIGEGGFGEVWMAEQREPVKRRVALKIIKPGMDSRQVVARFEAERQALAMMDHPNIAKVFDAGTTDGGRPYFVMELVRGIKITDYCDQNQLPTQDRLRLVILVCQAIQHAHQKGIIHRDIKPSNILVTLHDGVPVPKVIDFGIAKATQQELTDKTVFTQFQQFIGTPAYISPEQAEMSGLDVDTRADIYSLGVLLYELLVGQTPFDPQEMMKGGLDALRQIIREREPLRPSTRLNTLPGEARTTAGKRRQTDAGKLVHQLRGDLDWIVMKCLEKDRTRRYETANGLAMDIQRHLSCEPVLARPPSQFYEFQKTVRRHKFGFAAAAAIILVLAVGITLTTWQSVRANRERERAEEHALTSRRNAYAADMFAAQQAFESGNLGRARDLLKAHGARPGDTDLRGFEWFYLWHLCRGENLHTFSGHSDVVSCVAFSPDGRTLASGSRDASVKLWDVATRQLVATLPAHTKGVGWLAFSNDGETLGTTDCDGLKLWNVKTCQLVSTLQENRIARVAFSPVGTVLAIGYGDPVYADGFGGPIKLWDYATHQVVRTFPEPGNRLTFAPDGKTLAAHCTNETVKLWNVQTGEEVRKLDHAGEVLCLSFSPDGQTLATGNWAGEVKLWSVATGERAPLISGHAGQAWSLAFSPDGKRLATSSTDQTVRLWNVATGKEESKLMGHGSEVWSVAFAPDGQTLASGGKDEMVMLWSTAPKRSEVVITNVNLAPSFSADGKLLATARFHGPVTVWNVAARQPIWVLNSEGFAQFASEGQTLATVSTNLMLRFWDVATQTLQRTVPLPGITDSTQQALFALRGNRLAIVDVHAIITLYDTTIGGVIGKFNTHAGRLEWDHMESVKFSADARLLATGCRPGPGPVTLWDVATQKELHSTSGYKESAQGLAFSPDGSLLASASYDGSVRFLRVATGEVESPLTGIREGCSGVAFAPDGRTLAVACEDGTVRLWNLATRREVLVLQHGRPELRYVVFSPDGRTLVSVGQNGTMRFWDAPRAADP
jgi:eukaryotic-like serine/threonine-protein kinase